VSQALRRLLFRAGGCHEAVEAFLATEGAPAQLRELFTPHVRQVLRRVDAAVGEEAHELWPVKLAALVHEVPPADLPGLLESVGFPDVAGQVVAVVAGFGAVWKANGEAALAEYVLGHAPYLRQLLLFELAHEGRPTAAMGQAAALAGVPADLDRWRLRMDGLA
jgi:hypothetical protein